MSGAEVMGAALAGWGIAAAKACAGCGAAAAGPAAMSIPASHQRDCLYMGGSGMVSGGCFRDWFGSAAESISAHPADRLRKLEAIFAVEFPGPISWPAPRRAGMAVGPSGARRKAGSLPLPGRARGGKFNRDSKEAKT